MQFSLYVVGLNFITFVVEHILYVHRVYGLHVFLIMNFSGYGFRMMLELQD